MTDTTHEVAVVGGGVAGRSAGLFAARHGLDTVVLDGGDSILRRNAHLENYPGFPAGIDARLLLELMGEQADRAGVERRETAVTGIAVEDDPDAEHGHAFRVATADGDAVRAEAVVAATKNEVSYLDGIEGVGIVDRGKTFVDVDERGRTGVDGLYAAGRLAEKPHQAIVAAGHGAEVAVTLLEDADRAFYHDWVAPEGYFTDRGRDLPPGCEEIPLEEHRERSERARELMRERLAAPHPAEPEQHPSLREE